MNVAAEDSRAAGRGKDQTHQELQRGRFTGAVCAQETEDLSGVDSQREIVQRAHFTFAQEADFVVFAQVVDLDDCHAIDVRPPIWDPDRPRTLPPATDTARA